MLTINKTELENYSIASQKEWLETNGLGGWSSSSVLGLNTRRYHGLLVASITPPTDRMVLLSKLDETIVSGSGRMELGTNLYAGNAIHPNGHQYIASFNRELFPVWEYDINGIWLKKTIAMIHGENTIVIVYEVLKAGEPFTLELLPLVAARNYHSLAHAGPQMHWDTNFNNGIFHNKPDGQTDLFISIPGSSYNHNPNWYYNFQYSAEQDRGLDYIEDLFNHGTFSVALNEGDTLSIIVSTQDPAGINAFDLLNSETKRRMELIKDQPADETVRQLVLSADQFIVQRKFGAEGATTTGATIIAGYHWFTDWGRDTMISLPGLCLSTGRFEDAKKILAAFAASVSKGMLPNRFSDYGEQPEYNNVDGTLWYFIAIHHYLQATGDRMFIKKDILPVLDEIIQWHFNGTRYHIKCDSDGLLFAGEAGQQLTWMDARIGNWVVTPRMGKPVEIQALWYNALKIYEQLLLDSGRTEDALQIAQRARQARNSFISNYWYAEGKYLYDNIDENGLADSSLRPNQLLAISLPYPLLTGEKAMAALKVVEEKLYTSAGLRTLPESDPRYVAEYVGDAWHRDSSYHQGTVWSWLLGPYVDALMAGNTEKDKALRVINDFTYHLSEACMGSVSEIFDANAPHAPKGCVAQAWGVAEVLRVIKKYELYELPLPSINNQVLSQPILYP